MERRPGTASRRRLEDEFYRVMNKFNNRQWSEFSRSKRNGLNLPEYQIDDIRADYSHDVREQKYQMLSLWQRRNGTRATPEFLVNLVENFLHPSQLQQDSVSRANLEPLTHDVGNRQPAIDSSDSIQERQVEQPPVNNSELSNVQNTGSGSIDIHGAQSLRAFESIQSSDRRSARRASPPLTPHSLGSIALHGSQSLRVFESTQNSDRRSARRESPPLPPHGGASDLESHRIDNDDRIHNGAHDPIESCCEDAPYSNSSTATFPQADVGDTDRCQENITQPKALASAPASSYHFQNGPENKATPYIPIPRQLHHFGALGGLGNIQINVNGQHAIGVQTNYYYGGKKIRKKSQPAETSKELAEYCSGVGEITVVHSRQDFYDEHLERLELVYKVTHRPKGAVLIINNSFPGENDERFGSDNDTKNIEHLWDKLGCKTFLRTEVKAAECIDTLKRFTTSRPAYESDFVVIVIMSHGGREKGEDVFYGANREAVKVKDVLEMFNNVNARRLQGLPKLFFFQFCRGTDVDMGAENPSRAESQPVVTLFNSLGVTVRETSGAGGGNDATDAQGIPTTRQPAMSDTMISFATQAGCRAFRNTAGGSWFINAIVNIFMRHAHDQHLVELMTMVNNAVSSKTAINEEDRSVHEGKEMSDFKSTLRKKLFLFPGFPEDNMDDDFL